MKIGTVQIKVGTVQSKLRAVQILKVAAELLLYICIPDGGPTYGT
jgi:hypothetical protein